MAAKNSKPRRRPVNGRQAEGPVYDFDDISYGWSMDWAKANAKLVHLQTILAAQPRENLTADEQIMVMQAQDEALGEYETVLAERDRLVSEVLVEVPRDWLVSRAPETLDWSDPASLRWVKVSRFEQLVQGVALATRERAKN